jgi:hypothetical protein
MADVHQIVDVGLEPALKEELFAGALNLAQCPNCGAVTQVATPMLYHDPAHELFMVFVPLEMGLTKSDQERLIGQLVQRAMDRLPAEQRRGYMLQPQTVLSYQSLMEKVLETEGITPEMMARQRAQSDLLRELISTDVATRDKLIAEKDEMFDGTFFGLMRSIIDAAEQGGDENLSLKLVNLQAKLYRDTAFGRRLERQQQALRAFTREARDEGGLSPKLLLKHVLANKDDELVVDSLVAAGQPAFNYDFFMLLTERIEKRQKARAGTRDLEALRERLLALQAQLNAQSQAVVDDIRSTIRVIVQAPDKAAAVRANLGRIDDLFLSVLGAELDLAERTGDQATALALGEVQALLMAEIERQAPPEIRLLNQLLRTEGEDAWGPILEQNAALLTPVFLQTVRSLVDQAREAGQEPLADRVERLAGVLEARSPVQ